MTWQRDSRRRAQLPRDWQRIRAAQLQRDNHRCVLCDAPATDVDHYGDPDDHTRLRSLCSPCHKRRTALQGLTAKGHGPARRRPAEQHPGTLSPNN